MTSNGTFDRDLATWLEAEAPRTAPSVLHPAVVERARHARQRPRWLVALRDPAFARSGIAVDLLRERPAYLLLLIGLLLVAMVVALLAGALRADPLPLGGNGSIVFSVQGNNRGPGGTHVLKPDGTEDDEVFAGRCPSYSLDGSALAWTDDDGARFLLVNATDRPSRPVLGTDHRVLLIDKPQTDTYVALSPDGTQVAWTKPKSSLEVPLPDGSSELRQDDELWLASVAGGPAKLIVPATGLFERFIDPIWSPDGRRIAFARYVTDVAGGPQHRAGIDVVDADGANLRRLTSRPVVNGAGSSWSPDGRYIAYLGLPDGTPVPASPGDDPPFSDPPLDVFVIGADGSGDRNLTNSTTREQRPAWSPDATRLAYQVSDDGERYRLATIPMVGSDPVGSQVIGPESPWFVWSPDGTKLLWVKETSIGPGASRSTLRAIDRDFRQPASTLAAVDGTIICPPSWQRLEP